MEEFMDQPPLPPQLPYSERGRAVRVGEPDAEIGSRLQGVWSPPPSPVTLVSQPGSAL